MLCMLFYGLMRPKEATSLRVCQLEWDERTNMYALHLGVTKNNRMAQDRPVWCALSDQYSSGYWLKRWLDLRGHYPGYHGQFCLACPFLFSGISKERPPGHHFLQEMVSRWARWTGFAHLHLSPSSFAQEAPQLWQTQEWHCPQYSRQGIGRPPPW
ncbi:MAG: hypothetical protein WB421_20125, partial [Terriglobales bacterium]